ncbi:hypothetical protein ACOMHN_025472 [Nucella lapillus]
MSANGANGDGGTKQRFELYIKASAIDKETKGSCPICQHWFMITCVLGEKQDDIDFKVYTVQADCPPKNFGVEQGWSKKFPVVMVLEGRDKKGQDLAGTKYDIFEELEVFFESINRMCPALKRKNAPNVSAMQAVEDLYNAFNISLPTGKENRRLASALKKMNDFLEEDEDCKFLVDDVLSFSDCYILPRLQHIRVAGKTYMNYDIPDKYTAIWKYLADAYQTEAFRSTMPSDQDIVFHYEKKVGHLLQGKKRHPRPTLQSFTYTLDIPEEIALLLQSSGADADANGDASQIPPPPVEEVPSVDITAPLEDQGAASFSQQQDQVEVSNSQQEVEVPTSPRQEEEEAPVIQQQEEVSFTQVSVTQPAEEAAAVGSEEVSGDVKEENGEAVSQVVAEEEAPSSCVDQEETTTTTTVEVVVMSEEAVVTNSAPPPAEEGDSVGASVATTADEEGQVIEKNEDDSNVAADVSADDDGEATTVVVTTTNTDAKGESEAVSDNIVTDVNNDHAGEAVSSVKITVTQDGDDAIKTEVGNGDVIKDTKGDVVNDSSGGVASAE